MNRSIQNSFFIRKSAYKNYAKHALGMMKLNSDLEESCYSICSNEQVLCEILLDICYRDGIDVNIVWSLCGDVIVEKLVSKSGKYSYPEQDLDGDFSFGGIKFAMNDVIVGGEMDD